MQLLHRCLSGSFALALLVAAGCGPKLNDKRTVTLFADTENERILYDMEVDTATIVVKSPGVDVNAYIVLQSNLESAINALKLGQTPKEMITNKLKTQDATFDIKPGRKPFALVLIPTGKKTEVSVTATGK